LEKKGVREMKKVLWSSQGFPRFFVRKPAAKAFLNCPEERKNFLNQEKREDIHEYKRQRRLNLSSGNQQ
jgi:hypothetical protein